MFVDATGWPNRLAPCAGCCCGWFCWFWPNAENALVAGCAPNAGVVAGLNRLVPVPNVFVPVPKVLVPVCGCCWFGWPNRFVVPVAGCCCWLVWPNVPNALVVPVEP